MTGLDISLYATRHMTTRVVGFSPQLVRLSDQANLPENYELAIESFYSLSLRPAVSVQPDLQYIVNPGGKYANALVATLRLKVNL